jgi:aspartate/tyrosine/aromatic aminotransferase
MIKAEEAKYLKNEALRKEYESELENISKTIRELSEKGIGELSVSGVDKDFVDLLIDFGYGFMGNTSYNQKASGTLYW